jgi:hypothetical protein
VPLRPDQHNPLLPEAEVDRVTIRLYRPSSRKPAALEPVAETPVGFKISQSMVRKALGWAKLDALAQREGRALWSPSKLKDAEDALAELDIASTEHAELARAIETQRATLAVHRTSAQIRACLDRVAPQPTDALAAAGGDHATRVHAIFDALDAALDGAGPAFMLWHHEGRLQAQQERKRRKKRLMDRAVHEVLQFCRAVALGAEPPPPPDSPLHRLVVVYVGDWMLSKQSAGAFAKKEFLRKLARHAIVIVTSEHNTTKKCGICSWDMAHPTKRNGQRHNGTVFCSNPSCASVGRFLHRDVAAAVKLVDRTICGFFMGGQLGPFERVTAGADAASISLFGTLTKPRPGASAAGTWYGMGVLYGHLASSSWVSPFFFLADCLPPYPVGAVVCHLPLLLFV